MRLKALPVLLLFVLFGRGDSDTVDISIRSGGVNATVRGSVRGKGWFFASIPFANDPVGDLRFKVRILLTSLRSLLVWNVRESLAGGDAR